APPIHSEPPRRLPLVHLSHPSFRLRALGARSSSTPTTASPGALGSPLTSPASSPGRPVVLHIPPASSGALGSPLSFPVFALGAPGVLHIPPALPGALGSPFSFRARC